MKIGPFCKFNGLIKGMLSYSNVVWSGFMIYLTISLVLNITLPTLVGKEM